MFDFEHRELDLTRHNSVCLTVVITEGWRRWQSGWSKTLFAEEFRYVNADDSDAAHKKFLGEFPQSAGNPVTVYELPREIEDFREVICWAFGDDC